MSKKPASLTPDLLARKGEAEPSTIDPSARMTLTAGSGFDDDHGGGRREPHLEGDDERDDEPRFDTAPDIVTRRPVPPEPEIIYTAEETQAGGGNARLLLIAILGLVIVGGIFLAMSGQERNSVAPVATAVAPVETGAAPATQTPAPVETTPETVTTTPPATTPPTSGNAPLAITPTVPATDAPVAQAPVTATPVVPETVPAAPVAEAAPVATPAPAKAQSGGAYVVQLLALQDEAAAKAAWKKVAKKHANILGGHALDIEKADLGAKGTWYRVRAAGFASKTAATSACAKLKAAGQDCIAKKR
ncbi:MAG: SPOR domain-containing protein [Pseudomonadota bacterium]